MQKGRVILWFSTRPLYQGYAGYFTAVRTIIPKSSETTLYDMGKYSSSFL